MLGDSAKNMKELGVMINSHNEEYTKDVSMKQVFVDMNQIVVRKSMYWMVCKIYWVLLYFCRAWLI